jgi:transposase-like protein
MLLLASSFCRLFKWRQFEPEVILLAVGWYLRFSLSYRDVEELLAERGLHADHVTVWRWAQAVGARIAAVLRRVFFYDLTREPLQYLIRSHFRFHL